MKNETLELNYFEIGVLMASLRKDCWDNMPRALWLKLHILSTKAYLTHPTFGQQAKEDIKKWEDELKQLNGQEVMIDGS